MSSKNAVGIMLAFAGVFIFSWSFLATRVVAPEMGGLNVALGRSVMAACCAVLVLAFTKTPFPKQYFYSLFWVGAGTVGFAVCMSVAVQTVPSVHGAVVFSAAPVITSLLAVLRLREKVSVLFWLGVVLGSASVVWYLLYTNHFVLHVADLWLIVAVLCAAVCYVEGGRLTRDLAGWQIISWGLVLMLPFIVPPFVYVLLTQGLHASVAGWWAFLYLGLFSAYLGFFPWYKGMGMIGVSKASSIQLLQPVMSLIWGGLVLHEAITWELILTAALVLASTMLCWKK